VDQRIGKENRRKPGKIGGDGDRGEEAPHQLHRLLRSLVD